MAKSDFQNLPKKPKNLVDVFDENDAILKSACILVTELYLIYLEIVLSHLVSQKSVRKNMADFGQIYVILTS